MKVPQFSPWIGDEEYQAIKKCFDSNWITEGPISREFSQKLLELIGSKYGVFAPNGTLALYLGLKAIGVGSGDEVIVPDFTFIASANAVEMTGARPVFIDVNRKNFQIDMQNAEKLLTPKTKAIMPVHIYGTVADMKPVMEFANKHNLLVIEDAAEAIGVHRDGKHAGTFGKVGCFSFFADKTITCGEGAFIVTDDDKVYENLLYLRNQGRIDRGIFIHPRIGYNFRMTDIQNAVGLVQLSKLEKIKERKAHILETYRKHLSKIKDVSLFEPDRGVEWIPFRVGVLLKNATDLMAFMKTKDIETRTFFYPLHRQPCYDYLKDKNHPNTDQAFPNATYGYEQGVCLPTFPDLADDQIAYVVNTIAEFQNRRIFYQYYDTIFKDKDYSQETEMVINLSQKYLGHVPHKALEIGCGTGNHTKKLAASSINKLVAIDTDSQMVDKAKEKINGNKKVTVLHQRVEDMKDHDFDIAAALFNVITYIPDTAKLESFMQGVANTLVPGGIFIFDCWNGIAAVLDPPKSKKVSGKVNGKNIESVLTSETDFFNQMTALRYDIEVKNGKKDIEKGSMSFTQTLWTPREINTALSKAGLKILSINPYLDLSRPANEKDWKIMYSCQKPLQ